MSPSQLPHKLSQLLLNPHQLPLRLSLIPRRPSNPCIVGANIILYETATPSLIDCSLVNNEKNTLEIDFVILWRQIQV